MANTFTIITGLLGKNATGSLIRFKNPMPVIVNHPSSININKAVENFINHSLKIPHPTASKFDQVRMDQRMEDPNATVFIIEGGKSIKPQHTSINGANIIFDGARLIISPAFLGNKNLSSVNQAVLETLNKTNRIKHVTIYSGFSPSLAIKAKEIEFTSSPDKRTNFTVSTMNMSHDNLQKYEESLEKLENRMKNMPGSGKKKHLDEELKNKKLTAPTPRLA